MFTEFMYIALTACLLLGACSEVGLAYGMSFDTLLEQRIKAESVVILVMEVKNSLKLKYIALRGHLVFEYQIILIDKSIELTIRWSKWVTEWVSRHMIVTCYSFAQ